LLDFQDLLVILPGRFFPLSTTSRAKAASVAPGGLFSNHVRSQPQEGTCHAPFGLLVPTRQSDSRQYGPFTCDLVEGVAVNDPHVLSILELNDTPRGQGSKRSANSLKRHSDVPSDVRAIHRQRDFRDLLAFGNVELFDELQKHREPPERGHGSARSACPLCATSGHSKCANGYSCKPSRYNDLAIARDVQTSARDNFTRPVHS
jgi:hypothetical protein